MATHMRALATASRCPRATRGAGRRNARIAAPARLAAARGLPLKANRIIHGPATSRDRSLSVAVQAGLFGSSSSSGGDVGKFASNKRGAIKLPAVVLEVDVDEVLEGEVTPLVSSQIAAGATMVVVRDPSGSSGGGSLYTAACALKEAIRGRATLLVYDRADIADAAEADGVLLTANGVPTVVARKMMDKPGALVARECTSAEEAAAASKEGASLVVIKCGDVADTAAAVASLRAGATIPLIAGIPEGGDARVAVDAGADGLAIRPITAAAVAAASSGAFQELTEEGLDSIEIIKGAFGVEDDALPARSTPASTAAAYPGRRKVELDPKVQALMDEEKALVKLVLCLLDDASPEMEEMGLLKDALVQLDGSFLMVVVGEFNAGKSSVINALLGDSYLKEGILPTTNEISVLKHNSFRKAGEGETVRGKDGLFVRYLPAELLTEVSIVDTPGTNVILDRQQQLTEEYVPRSDLVLFVISADRPFSESEVNFLKYIRRWGKKVIFVLNKIDMVPVEEDQMLLKKFVADNAKSLLNVDQATVLPVSARSAMSARRSGGSLGGTGFDSLENFVFSFLGGGGESMRLKLDTPLAVSSALLEACRRQLEEEMEAAEAEVDAVRAVEDQLLQYQEAMQSDAALQRERAGKVVGKAIARADEWVDSTLSLRNFTKMATYLTASTGQRALPMNSYFKEEIAGAAKDELDAVVSEHSGWLVANNEAQASNYVAFVSQRYQVLGLGPVPEAAGVPEAATVALETASRFDMDAAGRVLEEEMREATVSTAGAAGGSVGLGVVLTAVLPNTAEDLLGLAVALLAAYVGVLNLPLRRAEAKAKIRRVAEKYSAEVQLAMEGELAAGLNGAIESIREAVQPLSDAAQAELERVQDCESRRARLEAEVEALRRRVQDIE